MTNTQTPEYALRRTAGAERNEEIETKLKSNLEMNEFPSGLLHTPLVLGEHPTHSQEWHGVRSRGIGSSEAASVLGLDTSYQTPLAIWARKRGQIEGDDLSELEWVEWGNRLEPLIAERLQEEIETPIVVEPRILAHPEHPWMLANIDRWIIPDGDAGVTELKNVGQFMAGDWDGEPPIKFSVQLQHQLAVTGAKWGIIAALIGGNRFVYFRQERNDRFIKVMIEREWEFWKKVLNNEMPDVTGRDVKLIGKLYSENTDLEPVELSSEVAEWDIKLTEAKGEIKRWKKIRDEAEAKIKAAIGSASVGVLPDRSIYTFKTTKVKAYTKNVAANEYRVLRRKK